MKDELKKVSKNRQKKEAIVAELSEKVGRAKALVFTNYQGMTHKQLEELKKAIKTANAELVIAKNSLLKRSLEMGNRPPVGGWKMENLEGPTATLFAYQDTILPLKELAKTIRLLKLPLIKFGIFSQSASGGDGWQLLAEQDVTRLSTLPSREILIAQLVGGLKSPIYGLHRALNWNLQKLIMTLQVIRDKKEAISS